MDRNAMPTTMVVMVVAILASPRGRFRMSPEDKPGKEVDGLLPVRTLGLIVESYDR